MCQTTQATLFYTDKRRSYYQCGCCQLVFVPSQYWLSAKSEKQEYDKHINTPEDTGYRTFLNRIFTPVLARLPAKAKGLDFGCGPGPTLSVMFEEQGAQVSLFDKFYYPDDAVLAKQYDFVTATEVWEHLSDPRLDLELLWQCVKPGGVLGVMTKLVRDAEAFKGWHYKNDPTHIIFFSLATLRYLEKKWGAILEVVAADSFIFTKPSN